MLHMPPAGASKRVPGGGQPTGGGAPARDHELLGVEIEKGEVEDVRAGGAGGAAPPTPPEPKEAFKHIICFLVL